MANIGDLPDAPECPWWCTEHLGPNAWWTILGPTEATKICRRVVEGADDIDDSAAVLILERFADLGGVSDPTVQVQVDAPMSVSAAIQVAETMRRLAEMATAPATAAA